ncbi:hypothetical protein EB796_012679 [Bugula neritina]|uniref:Uncharacterized protein n=1 Tax=Bugula neritina TaxID=10212 RepID=A0A7J7JUF1_BUGNE|nr:hypothetical protein EB796_012679 [Bugula neritina]
MSDKIGQLLNLTYTGFAFLGLGALLVCVGVCLVILLVVTYRRMSGKGSKPFHPKTYSYGTAPYPQQDWGNTPNPHHPEANPTPAAAPDVEDNPPPYNKTTEALITPEIN